MHKNLFFLSIVCASALSAEMPNVDFSKNQKIAVQNAILAKVNGNTISMMDVKKKMDLLFHENYPDLIDSNQARIQFYEMSWRPILTQLIDNELILSDGADKEMKLTDGEIREEMEQRFGPNVLQTLDKIGLTYEETWKMLKNEMIVRRMTWWFVHSKAIQNVTPQDIRQSYRAYLQENPSYSEWKYRVVSIRTDKPNEKLAEEVYSLLLEQGTNPQSAESKLKALEAPGIAIQISNEFTSSDKELSELHKAALTSLTPGDYSKPSFQMSRVDKKNVYRIFYLIDKTDFPAPSFDSIAQKLRDELIQKSVVKETEGYLDKLRKHYGFDSSRIKQIVPDDLHPFSLQ